MNNSPRNLRIAVAAAIFSSSLLMTISAVGAMMFISDSADPNFLHRFGWVLPVFSIPLFLLFFFSQKAYAGSMIVLAALNYAFLAWIAWTTVSARGKSGSTSFIHITLSPVASGQVILPLLNAALVLFLVHRERSAASVPNNTR
ncbi:MAG TPA: hypothetical protein VKR52_10180 [Terracidiphilus sp.]|nr:hypothetical protein [Terracidiphilus sp.]